MQKSNLRFGVVGVGRIGKIHIENLVNRIPGAEVVAVCDVAAAELATIAAKFGIARTFADYRELLDLAEIDAVVICSSTDTHHQMIVDAAASGKQIFCEKPIDLSIEKVQSANEEVGRHTSRGLVSTAAGLAAEWREVNRRPYRETLQTTGCYVVRIVIVPREFASVAFPATPSPRLPRIEGIPEGVFQA